jgi:pectate lyase
MESKRISFANPSRIYPGEVVSNRRADLNNPMLTVKRILLVLVGVLVLSVSSEVRAGTLAFPGAEGFGASASGGRGGAVYHVTNLDDSGDGSLRDAVSQSRRIVVFDIGGVIHLKSQLPFASHLTVAGQTAPGDGITVSGQGVSFSHQQNVIVRYLRFRSSHVTSNGTKTLNVTAGSNMIFDHCSISWGRWDNVGFTGDSHDITLQNCVISEAISPQRFGALVDGGDRITIVRNLWIDNQSRNPKGKANLQFINNVVYNWGSNGYVGGHSGAVWNEDLVNNYFIKGPSSSGSFLAQFSNTDHVFQSGNLVDLDRDGSLDGRNIVEADFRENQQTAGIPTFVSKPFNNPPVRVTLQSAADAFASVIAEAGASLHRDAVDKRLIEQVRSLGSLGAIIDDETVVGGAGTIIGGTVPLDSDRDGIPDEWELAHGLNPKLSTDGSAMAGATGYTNVEIYLNSLVPRAASLAGSRSSE